MKTTQMIFLGKCKELNYRPTKRQYQKWMNNKGNVYNNVKQELGDKYYYKFLDRDFIYEVSNY